MYWLASIVVYLTFKFRVAGIWLATVLLYIHLGHTWALRKSTLNMVLRKQEIKASVKECKMKNLPTTWVGTLIRSKTKACYETADSRPTLFTFMKRSDWKCRPLELSTACEIFSNKMILNEVSVYLEI